MSDQTKILIFGYGNPGRQDDGLGIAAAEYFESKKIPNVSTDANYQLNAEDAMTLSEHDIVVFVDASVEESVKEFSFRKLEPDPEVAFTTHAMSAGSVLALCNEMYKKYPDTYMLGIRGFEWDFKECLSESAQKNLEKAKSFLASLLESPSKEIFQASIK